MAFRSNAYFGDPTIGAIAGNLGTILFGDPQNSLRNAQAGYFRARTSELERKASEEAAAAAEGRAALQGIGSVFGDALQTRTDMPGPNIDGSAGVMVRNSPERAREIFASRAGDLARAFPRDSGAIANLFSAFGAMSGDDGLGRSAVIAQGRTPGKDFAATSERADEISARDASEAEVLEGVRQRGANQRNAATIAAEDNRKDVQVFDGIDPNTNLPKIRVMPRKDYLAIPADQRPQIYVPGVAQVFNTNNTNSTRQTIATGNNNTTRDVARTRVQGHLDGLNLIGDNRLAVEDKRQAGANGRAALALEGRLAGQGAKAQAGMPAPAFKAVEVAIADEVFNDPKDPAEKSGPLRDQRKREAMSLLNSAERIEYQTAISNAYTQNRGDVAAAARAGAEYLRQRIALDNKGGWFRSDMRPTRTTAAPGAASAFGAGQGSVAAPTNTGQPQPPPPVAERVMGRVYETPRGPMTWTGTGWMPVPVQ